MASPLALGLATFADRFTSAYVQGNAERQRRKADAEARKEGFDFQREGQQIQQTFQRDAETRANIQQRDMARMGEERALAAESRRRQQQLEDEPTEVLTRLNAPEMIPQYRAGVAGGQAPQDALSPLVPGAIAARKAREVEEFKQKRQLAGIPASIHEQGQARERADYSLGEHLERMRSANPTATPEQLIQMFNADPFVAAARKQHPQAQPYQKPTTASAWNAPQRARGQAVAANLQAARAAKSAEVAKERADPAKMRQYDAEIAILSRAGPEGGSQQDVDDLAAVYLETGNPRRFRANQKRLFGYPLDAEDAALLARPVSEEEKDRAMKLAMEKLSALNPITQ